jgi:hypothetical protein
MCKCVLFFCYIRENGGVEAHLCLLTKLTDLDVIPQGAGHFFLSVEGSKAVCVLRKKIFLRCWDVCGAYGSMNWARRGSGSRLGWSCGSTARGDMKGTPRPRLASLRLPPLQPPLPRPRPLPLPRPRFSMLVVAYVRFGFCCLLLVGWRKCTVWPRFYSVGPGW